MILAGYFLCLVGLFISGVMVTGWYTTLIIYGVIHVGCAVALFCWCQWIASQRRRQPVETPAVLPERLSSADTESAWVITVHLN